MLPTTILIDDAPCCVVRPVDMKDLLRFIRNGKSFLLGKNPEGKVTYRPAEEPELEKWRYALTLHQAWGGEDDTFFGIPL